MSVVLVKNKKKSLVTWSFFGRRDEQKHVINFVWPNVGYFNPFVFAV
jgi:hypothetical protein